MTSQDLVGREANSTEGGQLPFLCHFLYIYKGAEATVQLPLTTL
jgi:hypothetical protein